MFIETASNAMLSSVGATYRVTNVVISVVRAQLISATRPYVGCYEIKYF